MPIIGNDLFNNIPSPLLQLFGLDKPGVGVAQSRYTHTPILSQPYEEGSPDWAGMTNEPGSATPRDMLSAATRGVNPFGQFIQLKEGSPGSGDPSTRRHEFIHDMTSPLMTKDPQLKSKVLAVLPDEVKREIPSLWSNFVSSNPSRDEINNLTAHEGLARFLTSGAYADPKWNKQKAALIKLFPTQTKGQIIRMLSTPAQSPYTIGKY